MDWVNVRYWRIGVFYLNWLNKFKKYREERNLSLEQVCNHLNYSRRIIEAIESGKTDFISSPYNYYCIKNYSKYIGLPISEEEITKYK